MKGWQLAQPRRASWQLFARCASLVRDPAIAALRSLTKAGPAGGNDPCRGYNTLQTVDIGHLGGIPDVHLSCRVLAHPMRVQADLCPDLSKLSEPEVHFALLRKASMFWDCLGKPVQAEQSISSSPFPAGPCKVLFALRPTPPTGALLQRFERGCIERCHPLKALVSLFTPPNLFEDSLSPTQPLGFHGLRKILRGTEPLAAATAKVTASRLEMSSPLAGFSNM